MGVLVVFFTFLPFLLATPLVTGALVTCMSKQVTSLKNSMTSSWLISRLEGVKGVVKCSMLCVEEERCVTFLHNDVMNDCHLFAVVKASEDFTSVATGYRYYETCRAGGYYGATCAVNSDCKQNNTYCFQTRCRCLQGYSFDASQRKCITYCTKYGLEFEKIPGYFINANNVESVFNLLANACLQLCRQATTYSCRSVDTMTSPNVQCSLANITKLDAPLDWMPQSAGGSTWVTVYYQRHCSL